MKNKISVEENIVALISKIGEKITIGKSKTLKNLNGKNSHKEKNIAIQKKKKFYKKIYKKKKIK